MSTRTLQTSMGSVSFDYGAQYMTVRDRAFRDRVARWDRAGLVSRWPAAGEDAWVGVPGMSAPVVDMAASADVRWSTRVVTLANENGRWRLTGRSGTEPGGEGWSEAGYEAVVVAVPAEQVAPLLEGLGTSMTAVAEATSSQPCWTVMAAFAEALSVGSDVLKDHGVVAWAARDSAKPGRSGPETWVIQAGPAWSTQHLERDRETVIADLLRAFAGSTGRDLPEPLAVAAHRWRYARSGRSDGRILWDPERRIGVCGDWLIGPKVEAAFVSGARLAAAMMQRG